MSFADFERGITGKQIQQIEHEERRLEQEERDLANWKESEHVLSILRKIHPVKSIDDKAAFEKWKQHLNDRNCNSQNQSTESPD